MHALNARAAQRGMAAKLYVESNNPVRSLYRRLRFAKISEKGIYEFMCRTDVPFGSESVWLTLFAAEPLIHDLRKLHAGWQLEERCIAVEGIVHGNAGQRADAFADDDAQRPDRLWASSR